MSRFFSIIPFVTFAGVGVFALTHGFFFTTAFCLIAAFLCVNRIE